MSNDEGSTRIWNPDAIEVLNRDVKIERVETEKISYIDYSGENYDSDDVSKRANHLKSKGFQERALPAINIDGEYIVFKDQEFYTALMESEIRDDDYWVRNHYGEENWESAVDQFIGEHISGPSASEREVTDEQIAKNLENLIRGIEEGEVDFSKLNKSERVIQLADIMDIELPRNL